MSYKNFYTETVTAILDSHHTIMDIAWIGTHLFYIDVDQFFEVAKNTNYDSGYGSAEIPVDLIIVFTDNSSLRRAEYDGSEWWVFNPRLKKPVNKCNLTIESFTDLKYTESLVDYTI